MEDQALQHQPCLNAKCTTTDPDFTVQAPIMAVLEKRAGACKIRDAYLKSAGGVNTSLPLT